MTEKTFTPTSKPKRKKKGTQAKKSLDRFKGTDRRLLFDLPEDRQHLKPTDQRIKEAMEELHTTSEEETKEVGKNTKPESKFKIDVSSVGFIPDIDPELTLSQNLARIKKHPGVQARFLSSSEDEVLFSGGRGSSKSTALIADPIPYCSNKNFRGLIIRRTMPELRELIARARELYEKAFPSVKWNEQNKLFRFPSGATIEFGYCDNEADLERYRGQEFQWVGIDEVAQFSGPWIIDRLKASMRTTDSSLPIHIRLTANPTGAGRGWLKKRFNVKFNHTTGVGNQEEHQRIPIETPMGTMYITRKWFHSTYQDNKLLMKTMPQYVAALASQTNEAMKNAELHGSWDDIIGLAFSDFDPTKHVIEPFDVPENWYRWRACDWGYSGLAVCLWFATDWDDNIYVYRELAVSQVNVEEFAHLVNELEAGEHIQAGYLDGSTWSKKGEVGETIGDTLLRINGLWVPADRSPGSRVSGKQLVHRALKERMNERGEMQPQLKFFKSCKEIIEELENLVLDPDKPEDIDLRKKASQRDDAYDALRYGLQAAPLAELGSHRQDPFVKSFMEQPEEESWGIIDSKFGV